MTNEEKKELKAALHKLRRYSYPYTLDLALGVEAKHPQERYNERRRYYAAVNKIAKDRLRVEGKVAHNKPKQRRAINTRNQRARDLVIKNRGNK